MLELCCCCHANIPQKRTLVSNAACPSSCLQGEVLVAAGDRPPAVGVHIYRSADGGESFQDITEVAFTGETAEVSLRMVLWEAGTGSSSLVRLLVTSPLGPPIRGRLVAGRYRRVGGTGQREISRQDFDWLRGSAGD